MALLKSFLYAFRGLFLLVRTERNFQIHTFALLVVIVAGIHFDIQRFEWVVIVLTSGLVLGLEGMNSALEKLCDEVSEERKESIRNIKDIAAGAVLISAIGALVVAGFIFYPYLF